MRELKSVVRSSIKFEYSVNYDAIYQSLRLRLGPDVTLFAPVKVGASIVSWYVPDSDSGVYHPLSEAPEDVAGVLLYMWEIKQKELLPKLSQQAPLLDRILHLPGYSFLYYKELESADDIPAHKYSLLVAGWGCKYSVADNGEDTATNAIVSAKKKHQNVIVSFKDIYGEPLTNEEFSYHYVEKGITKEILSNSLGEYDQKLCLIGSHFAYGLLKTGQVQSFEVLQNIERYTLSFSQFVSAEIEVVDQVGNPAVKFPLQVSYGEQAWNLVADGLGKTVIDDLLYLGPDRKLRIDSVGTRGADYEVHLEENHFRYVIDLDTEKVDEKENEKEDEEVSEIPPVVPPVENREHWIKVIDQASVPVPFYALQLSCNGEDFRKMTDERGTISLPESWSDGSVMMLDDPHNGRTERFVLASEQQEYLYQLQKEAAFQAAYLRVVNQDGIPIPSLPMIVKEGDESRQSETDANGIIDLGEKEVGSAFTAILEDNTTVYKHFIIEAGKDEYVMRIEREKGPVFVTLEDRNGKVVPNVSMTLTNTSEKVFSHYTNEQGTIIAPGSFFSDREKINVHIELPDRKVKDCSFRFQKEFDHYTVRLKNPFPWGALLKWLLLALLFALLFLKCHKAITINVVDVTDSPVYAATVNLKYTEHHLFKDGRFLYADEHEYSQQTDSLGRASFPDLKCSVFSYIFYTLSKADVQGIKGPQYGTGSFLFHWVKFYTLKLKGEMVVEVRSAVTNETIPGASVGLTISDMDPRKMLLTTDQDGRVSFDVLDINGGIDTLLVTKSGFSGAREVQLAYSSMPDLLHIVYLDPPKRCGWSANNDTATEKYTVLDYDMGMGRGTFRFSYYTHTAPDIIEVYDGSSDDYLHNKADLKFRFDQATNTDSPQDYVDLEFSNQYVCVVVYRLSSYWGYYVGCPQPIQ